MSTGLVANFRASGTKPAIADTMMSSATESPKGRAIMESIERVGAAGAAGTGVAVLASIELSKGEAGHP